MDSSALVEDGPKGIERVVSLLEQRGIRVLGAYLIGTTSADEESEEVKLRIVTEDDGQRVRLAYAGLRRDGLLPAMSEDVAVTPVRSEDNEASGVLDYARQIGHPPVRIRGVVWKGLFIEDALVVRYPEHATATA